MDGSGGVSGALRGGTPSLPRVGDATLRDDDHALLQRLALRAHPRDGRRGRIGCPTPGATRGGTTLAAAVAFGLIANAGFHALAMRRFGEYSPGVVTGLGVMAPASAHAVWRLRGAGVLGRGDLLAAALLGAGLNAAAVGSLRLDAPRLGG